MLLLQFRQSESDVSTVHDGTTILSVCAEAMKEKDDFGSPIDNAPLDASDTCLILFYICLSLLLLS